MARLSVVLLTLIALAGCGTLQSAYNSRARHECDRSTRASERGDCYDRVDQNARAHR